MPDPWCCCCEASVAKAEYCQECECPFCPECLHTHQALIKAEKLLKSIAQKPRTSVDIRQKIKEYFGA